VPAPVSESSPTAPPAAEPAAADPKTDGVAAADLTTHEVHPGAGQGDAEDERTAPQPPADAPDDAGAAEPAPTTDHGVDTPAPPGGTDVPGPLPAPIAWADTRWPADPDDTTPEPASSWPATPAEPGEGAGPGPASGDAAPSAPASDALWPPAAAAQEGATLWPTTWPTDAEQSAPATPSWAGAPPVEHAPPDEAATTGAGGDGGSIGDLDPLAPAAGLGNGRGPDAPLPFFPPVVPPPELDELPAWYTDPLPNSPTRPPESGPPASLGDGPAWPTGLSGPGSPDPGANGNGNGSRPGPGPYPPAPGGPAVSGGPDAARNGADGGAGNGRSPGGVEQLPGAGDELRSLFGEVVRDPTDSSLPRPAPPTQVRPLPDPLGPPDARPPIDLSALDAPLGPTPFLGSSAADATADAPVAKAAPRLPRRHEVETWQQAGGTASAGITRLPRASEMPPVGAGTATKGGAAGSGPPAVPLIILLAVVAVLVAGVAWLVLTGDDGAPPASEREPAAEDGALGTSDGGTGAPADGTGTTGGAGTTPGAPTAPTAVTAAPADGGVEVIWQGTGGAFTVTVLTPDQAPTAIAATGTEVLVPSASLGSTGAWCVTVAATPAGGTPGPASSPVCSPDASVADMRGA
jgi:hypothetical protein